MTHSAFTRLAAAATISGLGDGATQIAGALLAMSLTRSPVRIAGLLAAQQIPWVLGALPAGALVDQVDCRRAMTAACLVRAAALLAFLSANLAVFSSVGATLRQSLAPPGMLGRVQGAYRAISNTGLLAGAALGGLLTSAAGLTAPLWLGLAAITLVIALAWRPFGTLGTVGVSPTAP
jgi:MFS family permease